ncbi:hypothetical protein AAFM46_11710 [Arthrobacter sp. TMP15]|uniref:hypothetical protein n=1 Tax=Arthrobacter sp. TMP15 TaxID=3140789 RepID=UPI0031BA6CC3
MKSKSRGRRNGLQSIEIASCNRVDNAGTPRTSDHSSETPAATPAAVGPSADHPPPAANPRLRAVAQLALGNAISRGEL